MTKTLLYWDDAQGVLYNSRDEVFLPSMKTWEAQPAFHAMSGASRKTLTPLAGLTRLQSEGREKIAVPVGVIGPRDATKRQYLVAHALGKALAKMGLNVLCGGKQGIMEAVCKGVAEEGGLSIGLLPEGTPDGANPYVSIPLATGIGIARNALIARAAACLIAVGGGYGTLSEIALGLQFEKPVFGIEDAPQVDGVISYKDVDVLLEDVAASLLGLK
jgi:hypothetical protein